MSGAARSVSAAYAHAGVHDSWGDSRKESARSYATNSKYGAKRETTQPESKYLLYARRNASLSSGSTTDPMKKNLSAASAFERAVARVRAAAHGAQGGAGHAQDPRERRQARHAGSPHARTNSPSKDGSLAPRCASLNATVISSSRSSEKSDAAPVDTSAPGAPVTARAAARRPPRAPAVDRPARGTAHVARIRVAAAMMAAKRLAERGRRWGCGCAEQALWHPPQRTGRPTGSAPGSHTTTRPSINQHQNASAHPRLHPHFTAKVTFESTTTGWRARGTCSCAGARTPRMLTRATVITSSEPEASRPPSHSHEGTYRAARRLGRTTLAASLERDERSAPQLNSPSGSPAAAKVGRTHPSGAGELQLPCIGHEPKRKLSVRPAPARVCRVHACATAG